MTTFLRLELASREGDCTLVNVDHIVRIAPAWPKGCTLVLTDDTSLHVRASLEQLQGRLLCTGGRTHVYDVPSPHTYALDPDVDEAYEAARADLLP